MTIRIPALLADVGLPMFFLLAPFMWVMILPVIAVEAEVLVRRLGLTRKRAWQVSGASNFVSTLLGIPAAWLAAYAVEAFSGLVLIATLPTNANISDVWSNVWANIFGVTLGAAWLGDEAGAWWAVPTATLVLLIPCFFASYLIERRVARNMLAGEFEVAQIHRASWTANLASYGLLVVVVLSVLGTSVASHFMRR